MERPDIRAGLVSGCQRADEEAIMGAGRRIEMQAGEDQGEENPNAHHCERHSRGPRGSR